jgi:hypothetical protein
MVWDALVVRSYGEVFAEECGGRAWEMGLCGRLKGYLPKYQCALAAFCYP